MTTKDAEALFKTPYKIVRSIQEAFNAPASTIMIKNGKAAKQVVPHVHIHVIPRPQGKRLNFESIKTTPEEFVENAQKIREKMGSLTLG